jgi:hypothetical protein
MVQVDQLNLVHWIVIENKQNKRNKINKVIEMYMMKYNKNYKLYVQSRPAITTTWKAKIKKYPQTNKKYKKNQKR